MESYSLSFDEEEFLKNINLCDGYIYNEDRKTWIKNYPSIVKEIDEQLRKYFDISTSKRLVFSWYNSDKKNYKLHQEKENICDRIIISSQDDSMKTNKGKKHNINSWEAYLLPFNYRISTDIYIDNKRKKTEGRKIINSKNNILIFEYMFNKNDFKNLFKK